MRKRISAYTSLTLTALLLLLSGCDRRPLEEELTETARIPVKIFWDQGEVAPKNASLLVYDEKGNLHQEWKSASTPDSVTGYIELAPGRYTAVAFNELRDQIDYVRMQGWERFETFEAYTVSNLQAIYQFSSRIEKEALVHQPGILATCLKNFTVRPDMIGAVHYEAADSDYYALSDLHPNRNTARANLIVHIQGLNNARMPAIAELRHMASGYIFATDRNTLTPVTTQFTMNNRTYDPGSKIDGTISATVTTFGVLGEWHHTGDTPDAKLYLDIALMLVDAQQTIVEYSIDITELIEIVVNEHNGVTLNINVSIPPLPDVKPVGGNAGFETDLVNWDKVIIPIPQ